jgi:hypothetical protein
MDIPFGEQVADPADQGFAPDEIPPVQDSRERD